MSSQYYICLKTPKYAVILKCNYILCYICAKFVKKILVVACCIGLGKYEY